MLNKLTLALILVASWLTAESGEETGKRVGALVFGPALNAVTAPAADPGR